MARRSPGGIVQSSEVFDDTLGLYRPTSFDEALRRPVSRVFLDHIGGPALRLFSNDSDIYVAARLDVDPVTTPMFKVCFKDTQDQTYQRTASLEGLIDAWVEVFDLALRWNGRRPAGWQLPPRFQVSDDLAPAQRFSRWNAVEGRIGPAAADVVLDALL